MRVPKPTCEGSGVVAPSRSFQHNTSRIGLKVPRQFRPAILRRLWRFDGQARPTFGGIATRAQARVIFHSLYRRGWPNCSPQGFFICWKE
jgi:hypothetical protein